MLNEALREQGNNIRRAFGLYQRLRIVRTARAVLSAREIDRLFHATGMARLVRNDL